MFNDKPIITQSTIKALGYDFADAEQENMFLDFANDLFTKNVGRAMMERLPVPEAERLKSQKNLGEREALKTLKENYIDINQVIEEVWKEFLIVLSDRRNDVMKSTKMKNTKNNKTNDL